MAQQTTITKQELIEFEWNTEPAIVKLHDGTEVMARYGDKFYGEEDADEEGIRFHFHVKAKQ